MAKELVRVDGQVVEVGKLSDLGDERLIDLAIALDAEIKDRIGRCEVCGERHSKFNNCPDRLNRKPPTVVDRPSDFEIAWRRRMSK